MPAKSSNKTGKNNYGRKPALLIVRLSVYEQGSGRKNFDFRQSIALSCSVALY